MRVVTLSVVASLALGLIGLASLAPACSESFPLVPAPGIDAGPTTNDLEAQPPGIVAPGGRVGASSSSVVFDPLRGGVWTANGDVGTLSYIDPVARRVVQEIPIGQDLRSVALSPDGAWVAVVDRQGGSVTLVDASARIARRTIPLGVHPRDCVWDAANPRWLYVTEEDDGAVVVIDRTLGALVDTIPVGRLPSGLAVSAQRREIYVSHRIDPTVTIVDLHDRSIAADVTLDDEPFSSPAVPNGKPLGLEALAITPDGSHLWATHELLSTTHPFVFKETIFPAISVVDAFNRVEQQTDPNSPVGAIAGRKNLFDAINIPGPNGQPDVFSMPCAVAIHPVDGLIAWALMCGSEDLLTFDVGAGVATDALRGLPCDHPSGMTLDDTGARIFVMCDQSKQLLTFDTAGGSLTGHTTLFGAPIDVAVDTVAAKNPQLRAGRKLFFEANSSKGALATTGNNWMSCAGCHLDGFGSTNTRLFEALMPAPNAALDAEIGHIGLIDNFSTAVQYPQPSFDPHDILVALLDQGGLAPDRTGANRQGQVDPSNPPAPAVQMAQGLALVIAGDLPQQPTWLQAAGGPPDVAYDGAWCGKCHQDEYAAWSVSVHAHSAVDPMVLFGVDVEQAIVSTQSGAQYSQYGSQYSRLCAGCHDPVTARTGDTTLTSGRGVTCLGCHDVSRLIHGGGNADLVATSHDWTQDHKAWAQASLALLTQPAFCGGCHRQFVPGAGFAALTTLDEYQASPYSPSTRCVDCHMPLIAATGKFDHRFPGGNVYMGERIRDSLPSSETATGQAFVDAQKANLSHVAQMDARVVTGGVLVTVRNGGAGHWFPTGVTDIREPWVELQYPGATPGSVIHIGGPDPATNLLPPGAARLGIDIGNASGTLLYLHQLSEATRIPFDVRVPSGEAQTFFIAVPSFQGIAQLDAVLYYRNVRTTFYQAASGDTSGAAPQTEMARVAVPLGGAQ